MLADYEWHRRWGRMGKWRGQGTVSAGREVLIGDGIEMVQSVSQYNANACSYDNAYVNINTCTA